MSLIRYRVSLNSDTNKPELWLNNIFYGEYDTVEEAEKDRDKVMALPEVFAKAVGHWSMRATENKGANDDD